MIAILSPAKTLNFEPLNIKIYTQSRFLHEAEYLVNTLKKFKPQELSELMKISYELALLNYERFITWTPYHGLPMSKQCILAYNGDVYEGLNASAFSMADFDYAQNHVRIISGLYGLLRPLDLIQPYRLEMGIKLRNQKGKDLYSFWGQPITSQMIDDMETMRTKVIINLASNEYFKIFDQKQLKHLRVITPEFREFKKGKYSIVSFYAKRARGLMTRFMTEKRLNDPEMLKTFSMENYEFAGNVSTPDKWVFVR